MPPFVEGRRSPGASTHGDRGPGSRATLEYRPPTFLSSWMPLRTPPPHRFLMLAVVLSGALGALFPRPARAQVGPALLGVAGGAAVGGYTTVAIYVTKARFGRYLFSPDELVSLQPEILPVIVLPVAGAFLGAESTTALGRSAGWGAVGFAAGAVVGGLTGKLLSDSDEAPWAGAVIGSGAGLLAGVILGAIDGLDEADAEAPVSLAWSLPLGGR